MTYSYINFDVSSQYCASLSGNLDDFKESLNNLYQDDVLFFSNYTVIKRIINISEDNWIIITLRIIPVSKPPLNKTTVLIFITTVDNLTKMADAYLRRTHIILVTSQIRSIEEYCNKLDKGKCLMYNGTKSNNAMVRPLLQDLVGYLHIGEPDYVFDQSDDVVDINPDNEDTITDKWPTGYCKDIPKISLNIVCPNSYVKGNYIKLYKLWIILVILSM